MSITVRISDGPLASDGASSAVTGNVGARVVFEGIVRGEEEERTIRALFYDVYEPMAQRMLLEIAGELLVRDALLSVDVEHSRGEVGVGERSFRLTICAPHRQEALRAMDEFITRMKQDVPIWKVAVWG